MPRYAITNNNFTWLCDCIADSKEEAVAKSKKRYGHSNLHAREIEPKFYYEAIGHELIS